MAGPLDHGDCDAVHRALALLGRAWAGAVLWAMLAGAVVGGVVVGGVVVGGVVEATTTCPGSSTVVFAETTRSAAAERTVSSTGPLALLV